MVALNHLIIATRKSPLALWQAEYVKGLLAKLYPSIKFSILGLRTRADMQQDQPLSQIGGKGLFVKELEEALLNNQAQIAVHSLKDMPSKLQASFCLAAVLERNMPGDVLISPTGPLEKLAPGTRIGTGSLRRAGQILAQFPHLNVVPMRGNIGTRFAKLDSGQCDALVLAKAGLMRLGIQRTDSYPLPQCLPAVGQGALAVECLATDEKTRACLAPLNHQPTYLCVQAERAFSAAMGGSCQLPLAAHAHFKGNQLYLEALVIEASGKKMVRGSLIGGAQEPEALGQSLAMQLKQQGADEILALYI